LRCNGASVVVQQLQIQQIAFGSWAVGSIFEVRRGAGHALRRLDIDNFEGASEY